MATKKQHVLTPIHLVCQTGNSNKFYLICHLPNGQAITGYGSLQRNGIGGTWKTVTADKARKLEREKKNKDYTQLSASMITPEISDRLDREIRAIFPLARILTRSDGDIEFEEDPVSGTAKAPRGSSSNAALKKLHVWI